MVNKSKIEGRKERVKKLGTLLHWKARIDEHLSNFNLHYEGFIAISRIEPWYEYDAYIHASPCGLPNVLRKVVKITLDLDEKLRRCTSELDLLFKENEERDYTCLANLPTEDLILDRRKEYSWI